MGVRSVILVVGVVGSRGCLGECGVMGRENFRYLILKVGRSRGVCRGEDRGSFFRREEVKGGFIYRRMSLIFGELGLLGRSWGVEGFFLFWV